jgi:hypothetical protein
MNLSVKEIVGIHLVVALVGALVIFILSTDKAVSNDHHVMIWNPSFEVGYLYIKEPNEHFFFTTKDGIRDELLNQIEIELNNMIETLEEMNEIQRELIKIIGGEIKPV